MYSILLRRHLRGLPHEIAILEYRLCLWGHIRGRQRGVLDINHWCLITAAATHDFPAKYDEQHDSDGRERHDYYSSYGAA